MPTTTNKYIRFPDNIIDDIEKAIVGKQCNFTAFVIEAVKMALINLDEEETNKDKAKFVPASR